MVTINTASKTKCNTHKQSLTLNHLHIVSILNSILGASDMATIPFAIFTSQFILMFFFIPFFFSDIAKVSANGTIIPEHNMSLHPYFNFDVQRNVTARVGQTAFLQCKVEQLGDKSVRIFPHSFNRNRMEAVSRC